MSWELKKFNALTNQELHDIFRLRVDIFVVEQACPYDEIDGKDPKSWHLMYKENGDIIAYARLLPPGLSFDEASIGRVVVAKAHRGRQLGYALMHEAVKRSLDIYKKSIKIAAQAHLEAFYRVSGFVKASDIYLDDGIPHIDMLLDVKG
ncbi:MAG: GNAT family N-acetyltransferase [Defluviitaleaceae bacterium]|nr:GNAT family N-acetyltransferase [Defluviitaleaceae bacterium]